MSSTIAACSFYAFCINFVIDIKMKILKWTSVLHLSLFYNNSSNCNSNDNSSNCNSNDNSSKFIIDDLFIMIWI